MARHFCKFDSAGIRETGIRDQDARPDA